jgi:hypothetical protein
VPCPRPGHVFRKSWKIWLEDRERGYAGGIYLFEDTGAAERYREKHERRLSAMGLTGVTANTFSINPELSLLAGAALRSGNRPGASISASDPPEARLL